MTREGLCGGVQKRREDEMAIKRRRREERAEKQKQREGKLLCSDIEDWWRILCDVSMYTARRSWLPLPKVRVQNQV